ncbi:MAG: hypothetical protein JO036_03280 [Candidatus Eremiobacteraeota bacterium]|nr:hypothetical protein [Candidatus Eremiobacteraeota bacterium]
MVLNDSEIERRCNDHGLIVPFCAKSLTDCAYYIHADRAFSPETGKEIVLGGDNPLFWTIAPAQALVLKTVERVRFPRDLMGMYTQLNRWSLQGLSLMNASLIEPEYEGPLSCQLVNFSNQSLSIKHGVAISKLTFHQVAPATTSRRVVADDAKYDADLSASAAAQPSSFLDIAKVEQRVQSQVTSTVWQVLGIPAAFLGILIGIAAVEPWVTGFINTHTAHDTAKPDDVSRLQADEAKLQSRIDQLSATVQQLRRPKKP